MRILYRQIPAAFVVNVVLGGLLFGLIRRDMPPSSALLWYGGVVVAASLRLILWLSFRRLQGRPVRAVSHERRFVLAMLVSAAAWGSGSFLLIPYLPVPQQLIAAATAVCLGAGITAATLASVAAILVFLGVGVAPYSVAFALAGTSFHEIIALMIAVFVVGTAALARNNAKTLRELIRLRLEIVQERDAADRANQAKSKFLAAASHDLRQPLHAMTLFAAALEVRLRDESDRQALARLQESLRSMRKMLNTLLDISRLDSGIVAARLAPVRLGPLLERLGRDFAEDLGHKGLAWICPPTELVVRSDAVLLETLLRNLLSNAVRYTERGQIAVTCRLTDQNVRVEVTDTGIGIPHNQHQEVFGEFMQLNNPERDGTRGFGLGLAIVQRLADLLGHAISLQSAPGEGSCFALVLSRESADGAGAEEDAPSSPQQPIGDELVGMTVLVIDDQEEIRASMQALLTAWGCRVVLAESEAAALDGLAQTASPEIIIADYRLRGERTGGQVVARLRSEIGVEIPALIITGDTAPERIREARATGIPLLHKPVPAARLRALLRSIRRGRRAAE